MQHYILPQYQLDFNGFPRQDHSNNDRAVINSKNISHVRSNSGVKLASDKRLCDRCGTIYQVDDKGMPLNGDPCSYHWGRSYQRRGYKTHYTCCNRDSNAKGCTVNKWHISENLENMTGFVRTMEKAQPPDGNYGVYALDCEMCYTTEGCDALRVTVVSSGGKIVYETLIKSINPVLDYNTRFSGITEEDLLNVKTTLKDVQNFLLDLLSSKTILVGHGLDADLRALRMIHDTVIDTSIVFPHSQGPPYKRSLKTLCHEYLKKTIQKDGVERNSAEGAISCMELMNWKIGKH